MGKLSAQDLLLKRSQELLESLQLMLECRTYNVR